MSIEIIQNRVLNYKPQTALEENHALKEIAQEIALLALSRTDFFKVAAFQGGTCLRIIYNLQRFSEDLDFVLLEPDPKFIWKNYISDMVAEFNAYGYQLEIKDRQETDSIIKSAFLKADSLGGQLIIKDHNTNKSRIKIKLEIDTNPPLGSNYQTKYLDFPQPFSIQIQDLSSLFASKIHALLCRPYVKGRDWYDFIWYVQMKTPVNLSLLGSAIQQSGPWQNMDIIPTLSWVIEQLKIKISSINWQDAKNDVQRFLTAHEQQGLQVWSQEFFLSIVEKLSMFG